MENRWEMLRSRFNGYVSFINESNESPKMMGKP